MNCRNQLSLFLPKNLPMRTVQLLLLVMCLGLGVTATAQDDFDITQVTADPNSKIFSDGRTTVRSYILSQLQAKTNCCGPDDIYAEVKYNAQGYVTSVRVLSSTNECNRKSLPEIIKYIRFDVDNPDNIKPIYLGLKPVIECEGTDNDNVYRPIPAPAGWDGSQQMASNDNNADQGNQDMASADQTQQQQDDQQAEEETTEQQQPDDQGSGEGEDVEWAGSVYDEEQGSDQQTDQTQQDNTQEDGQQMAAGGNQQEPAGEGAETQDTSGILMPLELPEPVYEAKNYQPNEEHAGSYQNTSGPNFSASFQMNSSKMAVFVKKEMRKLGVCGLAHVLVEIELQPDGEVSGLRFLKYNTEDVMDKSIEILEDMKFNTSARFKTYAIFEFKTYIDCTEEDQQYDLDSVADYFYGPGEEGRRRAQQNQGDGGNDAVELPTDR